MFDSQDVKALHKYFSKLALAAEGSNFLRVFNFISGHVDLKGSIELRR